MNERDREEIIERYSARLRRYGATAEALAIGSRERQLLRFDVLRELGIESGTSVLDLGCGLGDFLAYLRERDIKVEYTGYDITPRMVEAARRRFPDAQFETRDVQQEGIGAEFDFIVASQVFNNRLTHSDNTDVVRHVLDLAYARSRRGVCMDFLSAYVDFQEDHLYYFVPEELFAFAKTITKRVALRHDYPLFEFALYLYTDFQGWRT